MQFRMRSGNILLFIYLCWKHTQEIDYWRFKRKCWLWFDVNIHVNDEMKIIRRKKFVQNFRAFNKFVKQFEYDYCEDSTRVLTIKRKDILRSRIISSCDLRLCMIVKMVVSSIYISTRNKNIWLEVPSNQ